MAGKPYRGRLAPSPTGYLHLGHARTFWIAQQRARAQGGTLILRNEDLDATRFRLDFVAAMLADLKWFGFEWQEGPDCGGPFGPYSQSERQAVYLAAMRKLLAGGFIYPCTCSRSDVRRALAAPHQGEDEPIYPGTCRPKAEIAKRQFENSGIGRARLRPSRDDPGPSTVGGGLAGASPCPEASFQTGTNEFAELPPFGGAANARSARINWRFRVPEGETIFFDDGGFGPQRFVAGRDFGDFVVWRHDGVPAYQLSVTVDDAAMRISEVVRGADLLPSTARQLLLYRALGAPPPAFFHCPLLTDETGVRLAKRHDALSLRQLRERGRTPEELRAAWGATGARGC